MKVYLIMPVRSAHPGALAAAQVYCSRMEARGLQVHFPPRDAPQDDPTGERICTTHRDAMIACDEVHVLWDVDNKGSHFDLGMAYALGKPIKAVAALKTGGPGKSYWKAVIEAADPNAAALAADAID